MDITSMTVTELKALAYDQLLLLQQTQNNIRVIEEELRKREVHQNDNSGQEK